MSTEPVIINCLQTAAKINEEIQMFDKIQLKSNDFYQPESRNALVCYICIGKHNLFFVSKEMQKKLAQLSYLTIEKVALDTLTNRRFVIQLGDDRAEDDYNFSDPLLVIRSDFRQQLVDRIAMCWQAEIMFKKFVVRKFQIGKMEIPQTEREKMHNIDFLQVEPFSDYEKDFQFSGYNFFLRAGFKDYMNAKGGTFIHDDGWDCKYGFATNTVVVAPETTITFHMHDPISIMELERDPMRDDLRTVGTNYKNALTQVMSRYYVLVNGPYNKRMNRTADIAKWDGWEILIRGEEYVFIVILLRRMFIPPLCDLVQDICVLMRSPAKGMRRDAQEYLLDECRFVADTISPNCDVTGVNQTYKLVIQARLNALQLNEEAYAWFEGYLKMTPIHKNSKGKQFIKSIINILEFEQQLGEDQTLKDVPELEDTTPLQDPMGVYKTMLADYADNLDQQPGEQADRRASWAQRISRYLAYCLDGGILGDRFGLHQVVAVIGKCSPENDKMLRGVVDWLLHLRYPASDTSKSAQRPVLSQLLQDPDEFGKCEFNERVMRVMISGGYISAEQRKKGGGQAISGDYERLLGALLNNDNVGLGLRTLICRQIIETVSLNSQGVDKQIRVLVPALVTCLETTNNVNLMACATAAMVNLSYNHETTKILIMQSGCMKLLIKQLKSKDDSLILYTLFLLVNMTKTPQHRSVVVKEGGVALLVDILTSNYQLYQDKSKIIAEICSVIGQLCNDPPTRSLISIEYLQVIDCLLWVNDSAEPNTKLKSKLHFCLRQLCGQETNRIKVGQHIIFSVMQELGEARGGEYEECTSNMILLLKVLSTVNRNAKEINATLKQQLMSCKYLDNEGRPVNKRKFSYMICENIDKLVEQLRTADLAT